MVIFSGIGFIKAFLFFLPAGIANMMPVLFARYLPYDFSLDGGKTWKGEPLFGKNKTWGGLLLRMIAAPMVTYGMSFMENTIYYPYPATASFFVLGFALGFGSFFGDVSESFFKRRLKKQPGEKWLGFDQLDWVIGSFVFASFFIGWQWQHLLYGSVLYFPLHILIKHIGYWLGIEKTKW